MGIDKKLMFKTRADIRVRVRPNVIRVRSSETAFETVIRIAEEKTKLSTHTTNLLFTVRFLTSINMRSKRFAY